MHIIIPKPTKKALEKNGWKKCYDFCYCKKVDDYDVKLIRSSVGCWVPNTEDMLLNDLIAIANELKKLEEN